MKSKFTFIGENRITAQLISENYLWLSFHGSSGICTLYKSSVFNPNIRYWDVDITADDIKSIIEDTTYLYLALDYSTYIGAKVNKTTPSSISYFIKQSGIIEEAIDLVDDTTYVYFLTPGIELGENVKICKYNKSTRAFVETIDLATVTNAKKIDIDNTGVLWVVSDLDGTPKLTKVWYSAGWNYTVYTLA
jgi:hypothetical protein